MSSHPVRFCPLFLALVALGCGEVASPTPGADSAPSASSPSQSAPAGDVTLRAEDAPRPEPAVTPKTLTADAPPTTPSGVADEAGPTPTDGVELVPVKFDDMLARIAANKKAKLTLVDAWATWCGPCKENFPHVVEMHQKYADKGLAVVSLSLDDTAKPKQVEEAKEFLRQKKAVFTNFLLDEEFDSGAGFEKLNVSAIPAVFLYGPDGKELKRFTLDDPNAQFSYEEVEQAVVAMLDGKPAPETPPATAPKADAAKPSQK